VSNVVNHHPSVRPATRARVEQSVAELGYRPNQVARALRRGPGDALTLIVPRSASTAVTQAAEQLVRCARELGYRIVENGSEDADVTTRLLVITD
jgi:DNA-binding LacI/PurR family transcriptional regulator